jgi:DNA-binding MarR family transcriptional regulator
MNPPDYFTSVIDLFTHHFAELEAQALQESELTDLSMKQVVYLETISRMDSPTFSDLARELHVSKPSVTAIYTKLHEKGYINKVQSAEDKRTFTIHLTEKGSSLQKVHEHLHQKIARYFASVLSAEELAQLGDLLQKVARAHQ